MQRPNAVIGLLKAGIARSTEQESAADYILALEAALDTTLSHRWHGADRVTITNPGCPRCAFDAAVARREP